MIWQSCKRIPSYSFTILAMFLLLPKCCYLLNILGLSGTPSIVRMNCENSFNCPSLVILAAKTPPYSLAMFLPRNDVSPPYSRNQRACPAWGALMTWKVNIKHNLRRNKNYLRRRHGALHGTRWRAWPLHFFCHFPFHSEEADEKIYASILLVMVSLV